jgi:hypothetical protein
MTRMLLPMLSVRQPWASLIVGGWKDVENRTWTTRHRGPLVIHAGKQIDPAGRPFASRAGLEVAELSRGAVLGVVALHGVVEDSPSPWALPGQFHWLLGDARELPVHVPLRGGLMLREAPEDVAVAVMRVLGGGTRTSS